jgi:8-oxo-dGTP diphosphatase
MKVNFNQKLILLNKENKFLVLKAAYKGLKWDLPGGAVDLPETHLEAIMRELKEETGLAIDDAQPIDAGTAYSQEEDAYYIFIGYVGGILGEPNIVLSGEHTKYAWVTSAEFLELETADYLKDFVKKFGAKGTYGH